MNLMHSRHTPKRYNKSTRFWSFPKFGLLLTPVAGGFMAEYGLDAHWNFARSTGRFYNADQDGAMPQEFLVPKQAGWQVWPSWRDVACFCTRIEAKVFKHFGEKIMTKMTSAILSGRMQFASWASTSAQEWPEPWPSILGYVKESWVKTGSIFGWAFSFLFWLCLTEGFNMMIEQDKESMRTDSYTDDFTLYSWTCRILAKCLQKGS